MSGYPYGGNPQYPSPQNSMYPQLYNPINNVPGQPSAPGYPAPGFVPQPGFAYPQGMAYPQGNHTPGQPNPAAMSYPGIAPTAPLPAGAPYASPGATQIPGGLPVVTPTNYPGFSSGVNSFPSTQVEWYPATPYNAQSLSDRAVVAGYDGDGSPLWVIRARFEGDLLPGKLAIKHNGAYVPWGGKENPVQSFEVCLARPETVRWVQSSQGVIPPNAIPAGNTSSGEPLYVGRAKHEGSLTPGKVHPSHKVLYISYGGKEIPHKTYEILCSA